MPNIILIVVKCHVGFRCRSNHRSCFHRLHRRSLHLETTRIQILRESCVQNHQRLGFEGDKKVNRPEQKTAMVKLLVNFIKQLDFRIEHLNLFLVSPFSLRQNTVMDQFPKNGIKAQNLKDSVKPSQT